MGFQEANIVGSSGKVIDFIVTKAVALTDAETATFMPGLLYVGTEGTVVCTPVNGTQVSFVNVPSGSFLPVYIKAIHSSTTAEDMLVCY